MKTIEPTPPLFFSRFQLRSAPGLGLGGPHSALLAHLPSPGESRSLTCPLRAATRRRLQAAPCADIDGNGTVDVSDLLGLLASYGTDAGGDTNGDGNTDGARRNSLQGINMGETRVGCARH